MQYMDNFATFEKRSMYYKLTSVYYVSIILIHRSNTQMYDFVSLGPKYTYIVAYNEVIIKYYVRSYS